MSASYLVINEHCDPSSNNMLVLASTWLDDIMATATFKRQILSVPGIATEWFEDKVVRVIVFWRVVYLK